MSESVSQCVNKGMNEYHLRLEFLRESNGWPSLKAATPFILDFPSLLGSYIPISDICGNDFSDHLTAVLTKGNLEKPCQQCHCVINMEQGKEKTWRTTGITFLSLFLGL